MSDTREEFQCNTCGEKWVHGGDAECPFCRSTDTGPVEEEPPEPKTPPHKLHSQEKP